MKVLLIAIMLAVSLTGCGGGGSNFDCQGKEPQGVWEMELDYVSGNCGPGGTTLVNFSEPDDGECTLVAGSSFNNQCVSEGTVVCSDGETYAMEGVAHFTWHDVDYISGKMSVEMKTLEGSCHGLYEVGLHKL